MSGGGMVAWGLGLLAIPLVVLVGTAFLKFAVVLEILRRALAGGALPPAPVAFALALLFALFVAAPTVEQVWHVAGDAAVRGDAAQLVAGAGRAAEPVREFLIKHAPARERQSFLELQKKLRGGDGTKVEERDLVVLMPAFAVAELKAAFQVGFVIFLPFLLLDLLVAMFLQGMGLDALRPDLVSLPLKLAVFVAADGWELLFRGLVLSYT
jgi:type III secretion protein R